MNGDLSKTWWLFVLRGLLAVIFGMLAFGLPAITLASLVILFGAYALVDGIFALAAAMVRHEGQPWWALLLRGATGILAGLTTFFWPAITALALVFVIAAWAIVSGAFEIATAIRLRKVIKGEWLLVFAGIAAIVFGVLLAVAPGSGALALIWIIGSYSIVIGVLFIALGIRLRARMRGQHERPVEAVV
jgi:uncharacterized membrane protein HdeD (DUF308 family)